MSCRVISRCMMLRSFADKRIGCCSTIPYVEQRRSACSEPQRCNANGTRFRWRHVHSGLGSTGLLTAVEVGTASMYDLQLRRSRMVCNSSSQQSFSSGPPSGSPSQGSANILTLPTMLTLLRVAAIPMLIAGWYWTSPWATPVCTAIFVLAAITDWLDGYLARKMNLFSAFGAFLDPVADKLMVATVLILLCTQPIPAGPLAGNTWLLPCMTLAIIGREITMSALREWAATMGPEARNAVAVSAWGKWKTACQMVSLTLLLAMRDGGDSQLVQLFGLAGPVLLCVASYLTIWSLILYMRQLWRFMS